MGIREILEVACPQCGFEDDDVPFAPTCDFVNWKCPECGFVVDLMAMTRINYEDASNAEEIKELCSEFGMSNEVLEQKSDFDLPVYSGKCLEPTTIPCATCGRPTTFIGTKRCNWCWEVESRLENYLKFEKGRDFVQRMLWRIGL